VATKKELLKEAQAAGLVGEDASEDDYTAASLETLLGRGAPAWEGSLSSKKELKAADGHVTLSKEDIEARN
jgi:hypothetical protein